MKKEDYIWTDKKRTLFGLPLTFTRYILTDTKFITRKGFFNVEEDELEVYRITDKKLSLPFFQRIVNCGTIVLHVKDIDTPIKEITCVKNPRMVIKTLDKQINEMRDKYNIRGREMVGASSDDCGDEL